MDRRNVVVVAASAGGIEALQSLLAGVPADLAAAILIVLHMPSTGTNTLARILDRAGPLPAATAVDGELMLPGRVFVCAADHHLLVAGDHVHLRAGPREHGHRPAADPLFRSAVCYHGQRVIGVVLSGMLSDASVGLREIRRHGGLAVVQDPDDALYDGMPRAALRYAGADHVTKAIDIGPLLGRLTGEWIADRDEAETDQTLLAEVAVMEGDHGATAGAPRSPSQWPCPDCGGVLWSIEDGTGGLHFRCRVGHAWSPDSLLAEQGSQIETALWLALRSLEDRMALQDKLAGRAEQHGHAVTAARFRANVHELGDSIEMLRKLLGLDADADLTGTSD